MCTCSGAKLEHSSFVLCSLPVAQQACVAPWRDLQAFRSVAQWKGSRCRSARQPYQQPGCVAMVTKFEQCLALSNSLSRSLSFSPPLTFSPLHLIALLSHPSTPLFSLSLYLLTSPPFSFLSHSFFLSCHSLPPPPTHTLSQQQPMEQRHPIRHVCITSLLCRGLWLQSQCSSTRLDKSHLCIRRRRRERERERERKKERESKLKIVDGGWGGDGGAKSKEAEPPLRATAKTR